MAAHELDSLLATLSRSGLRFVVLGGIAVGVHGYVRATTDLDICPDPTADNLETLAQVLRDLAAQQLGVGDFESAELPFDPLDPTDLAKGENFRLRTRLGALDVMQWISGIDEDQAFVALDSDAVEVDFGDQVIRVCSLAKLRIMKRTAGRPQDLLDLENLPEA
jgi:hypothetical protein